MPGINTGGCGTAEMRQLCGEAARREAIGMGGTQYSISCHKDVALVRMFGLALVQLLQLLQAPKEPTEFKAQFLCFSSATPTAQLPALGHRDSWVLLNRTTKSSSWFRSQASF